MKSREIRESDKNVIQEKLSELKKELVKLNAQIAVGGSIKSPGQVKRIKKDLARIMTIEAEKKRGKEKKSEGGKEA